MKEGDKNIRFFHKMANVRRSRNHFIQIKINSDWFIEGIELKTKVAKTRQGLLEAQVYIGQVGRVKKTLPSNGG